MNDDEIIKAFLEDTNTQTFRECLQKARKDERAKAKEEVLNEIKQKLYLLDWITIFKNAYENRKTSWESIGHIREWRNATDEVMSEVIKELFKSLSNKENPK